MFRTSLKEKADLRKRILKVVEQAEEPLSVDAIKTRTGASSWHLVQSLLFDLMVEGKIVGMRTSKRWVFGKSETMKIVKLSRGGSHSG